MTLDQEAFNAGFTSVAAYQRHLNAIGKKSDIEAKREPIAEFEPRRSDRFMPAGMAGVPVSKNRLAEQIRSESEEKATELYRRIVLHKKAGIPVNHDKAALGNLLGYRVDTIREFEDYFHSDACAQRFGTPD